MRRSVDETPAYRQAVSKAKPLPMLQDGAGFKLSVKACGFSVLSNVGFYIPMERRNTPKESRAISGPGMWERPGAARYSSGQSYSEC